MSTVGKELVSSMAVGEPLLAHAPNGAEALPPSALTRGQAAIKRSVDIVGAFLGLLLLAPVGLFIALAIRLDSEGPVVFRQTRVGRDGRSFQMFKFRTMIVGAHEQRRILEALNETTGVFKLAHDPRVTRVGRILRDVAIDELPQLINVLRGDMSFVGPRPLVPEEDRLVGPCREARLAIRPGLTGPWQRLPHPRPPLEAMVELDCAYASRWTLQGDIRIVLATFAEMVRFRGL